MKCTVYRAVVLAVLHCCIAMYSKPKIFGTHEKPIQSRQLTGLNGHMLYVREAHEKTKQPCRNAYNLYIHTYYYWYCEHEIALSSPLWDNAILYDSTASDVTALQVNAILSPLLSRTHFSVSVTQGVTVKICSDRVTYQYFRLHFPQLCMKQVFALKVADELHYLTVNLRLRSSYIGPI